MAGSNGFPRLVAHIKHLHLSSDDRRGALREALSTYCELFVSVGEALKASDQWLCGVCMCLHALSRACHRTDGMTRFKWVAGDVEKFIVGIVRPQVRREVAPLGGVVVDEVLLDRVFSLPIMTVKSIPRGCRMAFSHALAAALCLLTVRSAGLVTGSLCNAIVFNGRWQLGGGDGFIKLIPSLFAQPLRVGSGKDDRVSGSDSSTVGTNVKQCLRKVSDGHFTAVVKVLCCSWVSPFGTDTLTALLAKHPILPPPVMHGSLPSEPPLVVEVDSVLGCIQSFPKGTSCGRDGLRAQHILDALCGEGSAIAVGLLKAISVVVNLLLEGRCPKVLAEFVASAPLMPLLKPDNGIRPIAVGAIWRRLASKVAMKGVRKEMSKYLEDFQFGVGVPSGADAVLYGANRFLNKFHSDRSLAMLTVDLSNAFNLVDRTTLLYERGDPLGPLLFALVLHPLVHRIRDCCQLLFHAWYLDDGIIIGDTKEVAKAIDIIRAEGPRLGLELNIKKKEVFWPSCNGVKEGLFPRDIERPKLGVKLLGGAVSRDMGFISSLAVKRASRVVELMSLLSSLWDPQSELLLLRSCMGVAKLLFGLRTCQPMYIGEAVSIFDNGLRRAIEAIVVCGGPFFRDFQWRLASLPIRFGGLGLCSAEDVSTYAFVASRAQSWSLQDHILQGCGIDGADSDFGYALDRVRMSLPEFDLSGFSNKDTPPKAQNVLACALFSEIVKNLGVSFDLSPRQKAVVECLRAPRAQNFLTVIPIEGLGQHMSALEYRTILKYRLMIPLFLVDEPCPVCRKVCLDSFGPLEGRSTLRPVEILVFGWDRGKHACVDLTGVSPLVGIMDNGFVAGQAALKAESSKVAKHEKACL
ncbi:putative reverse transcriptase domain-containing protein [Tanacetum coccineum]